MQTFYLQVEIEVESDNLVILSNELYRACIRLVVDDNTEYDAIINRVAARPF